jgi:glycosyltransferase involved in cell wall biosynthesis
VIVIDPMSGIGSRLRARLRGTPPPRPIVPGALLELERCGPVPLAIETRSDSAHLRVATVIPSFRRGSGGHGTIVRLLSALQDQGHEVSIWLEDSEGWHTGESPEALRRSFGEMFDAEGIELHGDFTDWQGADVTLATGWQTVARVLLLSGVHARAYLVQDHEPDFYPASAESLWAERTYRQGLHCIAASEWLAALLRERYGASTTHFDLAVDHDVYAPEPAAQRRDDLVVFYARASTPRRAVPLGLSGLAELAARRPSLEIALFGEPSALAADFPRRSLGVLDPDALGSLYRSATVGLALSVTNPSLVCLEMMACGLPCVELASESMLAGFPGDGPPLLARPDAAAICGRIEDLLDNPDRRRTQGQAAVALMAGRTWERAAKQVAEGLRGALEGATGPGGPPSAPR